MAARFHAPAARAAGDVVALPAEESEHLARVLRLGAGAAIRVFDGKGREFHAVVEDVARGVVRVRIGDTVPAAPEPRVAVTLAQAVLKGDKMDDIVRDIVMMGAVALQPMITDRSEVTAAALERGRRVERWRRIAIASAKQCGRSVVPAVNEPLPLVEVLRAIEARRLPGPAFMLAEPQASAAAVPLRELEGDPPAEATLLVGPEGGWTPQEGALAGATCRLVLLGGLTLRADAAPMVALSACFARWGVY